MECREIFGSGFCLFLSHQYAVLVVMNCFSAFHRRCELDFFEKFCQFGSLLSVEEICQVCRSSI